MSETTRTEVAQLRRELRKEKLRAEGWRYIAHGLRGRVLHFANAAVAEPNLADGISDYKYKEEPSLHCRLGDQGPALRNLPRQAIDGVYGIVGADPMTEIPSLVDLTFFTRKEVEAAPGVGPKAMEFLDAAMDDAGLSWVEDAEAVTV